MSKKLLLPYTIGLILATLLLSEMLRPLSPIQSFAQGDCRTFPETGKQVCGRFLQYWTNAGGLAQQGLPISNEFTEVSDLNGQPYTVQYFERAVFEKHPENAAPYDVLLSQLGTFQFKRKYPNGEPGNTKPPSPAPTPTTQANSGQTWEPRGQLSYESSLGDTYVVGAYKYNGSKPIAGVELAVTKKGSDGKILATKSAFIKPTLTKPGQLLPFIALFDGATEAGATYEVTIQGGQTSGYLLTAYTADFTIVQADLTTGSIFDGGKKVVGQIKNDSAETVQYPSVIAAIWDGNNNLVDVAYGSTSLNTIAPGQQAAFQMDARKGGAGTRVDIVVSASIKR